MKLTFKLFTLAAMMALFAIPAWAQAKECSDDFKQSTYSKWYDNRKDHQDIAYQAAKDYLSTCPADDSAYATALKKFATAYEAATSDATSKNQLEDFFNKKNWADAVRTGKQVVTADAEYARGHILITLAAYNASTSGDGSLLPDSIQYANKAIDMIQAGKAFAPFQSKEQALAWENFIIGTAMLKNNPGDAIPYFLKAARIDSDLKKNPVLYVNLASAYNDGPRAKLTDEYRARGFTVETDESKLMIANINQVIDRQIDALARAAALATDAGVKKGVMDALTETYKDRTKSTAGLNELVASVLNKPLPDMPTPLTQLPTPAATPTSTAGSQPAGTVSSTPATNKPAANSTTGGTKSGNTNSTTTTATKPAVAKPSPTPKPRSRANHRRR